LHPTGGLGDDVPEGVVLQHDRYLAADGTASEGQDLDTSVAGSPGIRWLSEHGFRRCWLLPLALDGEPYGTLALGRRTTEEYTRAEQVFLRAVGRLLCTALCDESLQRETRDEATRSRILNDVALLVNGGKPLDEVVAHLLPLLDEAI